MKFAAGFGTILGISFTLGVVGCSHSPTSSSNGLRSRITPQNLLVQACTPGARVFGVKGVVWLKAKSQEASGQFPASVQVTAPDSLKMEVEGPLGGTYATLSVEGTDYKIDVPGKPEQSRVGKSSWGGIPLKWATELFLGRIPCLDPVSRMAAMVSISDSEELIVEKKVSSPKDGEKFTYSFTEKEGRYIPTELHWQKGVPGQVGAVSVDFEFSDFDRKTSSPLRWQAKSSQGEVKIHWRDREIIDSKPHIM